MTTGRWIAAVVAAAVLAGPVGYWLRYEIELARRASGRTIDFTRKRVGA